MKLTLITRRDCHLCAEMATVIAAIRREMPLELAVLDVDADAELRRLHGEEVPVLLVNGRKAFKYRVSESELRRRLGGELRRERLRALTRFLERRRGR